MLKFGDNLFSKNQDMTQNKILQSCDLERSRLSVKVETFSSRPLPPTHKYTRKVPSKSYCQFFHYGRGIVDRKVAKREAKRNNLTGVDTL